MEYVLFGVGYLVIGITYTILVMRYFSDGYLTPNIPSHHDTAETSEILLSVMLWWISLLWLVLEVSFMVISVFITGAVRASKHEVKKPNDN